MKPRLSPAQRRLLKKLPDAQVPPGSGGYRVRGSDWNPALHLQSKGLAAVDSLWGVAWRTQAGKEALNGQA